MEKSSYLINKKTCGPENQRMAAGKEKIKDKQTNKQTNKQNKIKGASVDTSSVKSLIILSLKITKRCV